MKQSTKSSHPAFTSIGHLERLDPQLDAIIDSNARAEIIAEGFEWSEGPLCRTTNF